MSHKVEKALLALNPKVPSLWLYGHQDWRDCRPLSEEIREFGWSGAMQLPEVQRLVEAMTEILNEGDR